MRNKIVVIGSLNYDTFVQLPHFPKPGENVLADGVAFGCGGKGANQAVQAAKLGVDAYMVGCVGNDQYGDALIESAQKYGLNTDHIRRVDAPTGMGFVNVIEDGSVFAGILKGANFEVTKEDVDQAEALLMQASTVILQMEIPQDVNEYAIEKAKECGAKVIMNAAPAAPISEKALKSLDILVVNEVEAGFYLGKDITDSELAKAGAKELKERYGCDVIITLGKLGSVVNDQNEINFIPSKKVKAVETTGAGDSFIGGVGYALLQGMSLTAACEFATCCSAITVCGVGAQNSMPTFNQVKKFIENN
ncbi:MAG: ribokinase [Eubacteriales bacterium]|nr:ribokinase [Eubacteriales bacterium]